LGERDGGVGGERCGAPGWWRRGDLPGDLNLVRVRRRRGVVIVLGFPIVVGALGGLLALLLSSSSSTGSMCSASISSS
jgi:hypothetical protein